MCVCVEETRWIIPWTVLQAATQLHSSTWGCFVFVFVAHQPNVLFLIIDRLGPYTNKKTSEQNEPMHIDRKQNFRFKPAETGKRTRSVQLTSTTLHWQGSALHCALCSFSLHLILVLFFEISLDCCSFSKNPAENQRTNKTHFIAKLLLQFLPFNWIHFILINMHRNLHRIINILIHFCIIHMQSSKINREQERSKAS